MVTWTMHQNAIRTGGANLPPAGGKAAIYQTPEERRVAGKALREAVPRRSHSGWKPAADRADPIDLLLASNQGRLPDLIPIRHARMAQSVFAFFRGSAAIMAADLARTPASGIRVQACGDCHLLNFGAFATPERRLIFDINDFDETLPAPFEWDVKRLAASFVVAGRHIGLTLDGGADAAAAVVRAYREQMALFARMRQLEIWYHRGDADQFVAEMRDKKHQKFVRARIEKARRQGMVDHDFPKLAENHGPPRIKDNPPLIFHTEGQRSPEFQDAMNAAVELYRQSLPDHCRALLDRFKLCDAAVKVVGVGSVGTTCAIGLFMAADDDPLFLQFKEARASVLEPYAGASAYRNNGQRVAAGQRLMQSAGDMLLGWTHGEMRGRDFYVRQLRDMKIAPLVGEMNPRVFRNYGIRCGQILAQAHARSGGAAEISGYLGTKDIFDTAVAQFAIDYADQADRDYKLFVKAVRDGRVETASG